MDFCIIQTISIFCRVPKRDAEMCGNVDLKIGFAQLACQLSTVNIIYYSHPYNAWLLQIIKTPEDWQTESWSLSF